MSKLSPIALLLACLALEACVLRIGIDDLDEGYFIQQAARVLHGQVPFRDFQTLYSPGLAYLHAGLFAILGGPSLLAMRALALGARAALVLIQYALARPLVRNSWWAVAPGLVLLLGIDDAPVRWEPHPGWLSTLFAVVAVWCLTHRRLRRWLFASGAAVALAFVFKQNTGLFMLAAVLVWTRRWEPLAAFAMPTLIWLVPLAVTVRDISRMGALVGVVNEASLFAAPEPTLLIPLAAIAGGLWLLRRDSQPHLRLLLLGGCALLLTEFPRPDTLHLVWSTPVLLVVGAIALERVRVPVAIACLALSVALLAPTWTSRLTYVAQPMAPIADVVAPAQTAADLNGVIADIQQRTSPGEPIFVYPTSPLLYVLSDRPNPTRFDHLNPGAANAEQLQQVISDLSGVRTVVISDFWVSVWGPDSLDGWLRDRYSDEVARSGTYGVYNAAP